MDTSMLLFPKPKDKKQSTKQTRKKACDISQKIKHIVWIRDNKRCIYCKEYVSQTFANAHYIKRSQGGKGIEENIFTACANCHYEEDFGKDSERYRKIAKSYLKSIYGANWQEKNLYYKKGE